MVSSGPWIFRFMVILYLRQMDLILVVNQSQKEYLESLNLGRPIRVIPAFLPPVKVDESLIPPQVSSLRKNVDIIIVSSGYCTPLYRYEDLLTAASKVQEATGLKVGVIICCYGTFHAEYHDKVKKMVAAMQNGWFAENLDPDTFVAILSISDIYVRATTVDGDAVSIREAGFLGKKIVASDAISRPAGSLTYAVGDVEGLTEQLLVAINSNLGSLIPEEIIDRSREFLAIYGKDITITAGNHSK